MKLIDKLANAWWMDQETDSLTEAYKDGFRAARELASARVELGFGRSDVVQDVLDDLKALGESEAKQ